MCSVKLAPEPDRLGVFGGNNVTLENAVAALPEKYQPIYGHSELSGDVSRGSLDRLINIFEVYEALSKYLGRALRVLDLGCAQGFFSFSLAEKGAAVLGVDYDRKNIDVCEAIRAECPGFDVSFQADTVENVVNSLRDGQFDLVLGFSVFHHIINAKGLRYTLGLLEKISQTTAVIVAELALKEEPLYWARHLPEDPRVLLRSFPFVFEVAQNSTHLSDVVRPIFVASAKYCFLGGNVQSFNRWSHKSNALAIDVFGGTRSYYYNDATVVKIYRLGLSHDQTNRRDMRREREVLTELPQSLTGTRIIDHGETETAGWNILSRKPGTLLSEILANHSTFNADAILEDLLIQLTELESSSLYHNDVRTWNVLVDDTGHASLIDFASVVGDQKDCSWPGDLFLSFFMFVNELFEAEAERGSNGRRIKLSPFSLPPLQKRWATEFWRRPRSDWSFSNMLADYRRDKGLAEIGPDAAECWNLALESGLESQRIQLEDLQRKVQLLQQGSRTDANDLNSNEVDNFAKLERELELARGALSEMTANRDVLANRFAELVKGPLGLVYAPGASRTIVGAMRDGKLTTTSTSGMLAFGPYIPLNEGDYELSVQIDDVVSVAEVLVDVVSSRGAAVLMPATQFDLRDNQRIVTFKFSLPIPHEDVEVRLMVGEQSDFSLDRIAVRAVTAPGENEKTT